MPPDQVYLEKSHVIIYKSNEITDKTHESSFAITFIFVTKTKINLTRAS